RRPGRAVPATHRGPRGCRIRAAGADPRPAAARRRHRSRQGQRNLRVRRRPVRRPAGPDRPRQGRAAGSNGAAHLRRTDARPDRWRAAGRRGRFGRRHRGHLRPAHLRSAAGDQGRGDGAVPGQPHRRSAGELLHRDRHRYAADSWRRGARGRGGRCDRAADHARFPGSRGPADPERLVRGGGGRPGRPVAVQRGGHDLGDPDPGHHARPRGGIDYSLFIIHRHRRQLKEGYELTESIALANGTSGSAVLFAGITVLIALLALNVTGIPFLGLMGTVGAVSIAVAVLVALTLTPAWLKVLGMRVLSRKERARVSESATTTAQDASVKPMGTWSAVLRAVGGIAVLVLIALPATSLRLNLPDGSSEPHDSTQYQAYSTIADKFGPGTNGPLLAVVDLPEAASDQEIKTKQLDIGQQLAAQDDVTGIAPIGASEDNTMLAFQVIPAE